MGFDLAKAAGYSQFVSNLDSKKIEQIPVDRIAVNDKNFFSVDDVQDLQESIAVNGILQPLLLVEADTGYRIVAGHRRFKAAQQLELTAVPAVILPEMTESMEWFVLLSTNTATRVLTYAEKLEAATRMKKHLVQLKKEGAKITGRLNDIVAEQLELSATEVKRMAVIDKNLIPEAKELMKKGQLTASAAYELARTSPDCQQEILDEGPQAFTPAWITDYAGRRELDYLCQDCPHPEGFWQHERKRLGKALPCPEWKKISNHKAKGHPENCPGCCAMCDKYKNGYSCPDVCINYKSARFAEIQKQALDKHIADRKAAAAEAERHFMTTPFAGIGKLVRDEVADAESFAEAWTDELGRLYSGADSPVMEPEDVARFVTAREIGCVEEISLPAFLAFCRAADRTPNELLGYGGGTDAVAWHRWPEFCPDEKQRVVVLRKALGMIIGDVYVYQRGEWWMLGAEDPEIDRPAKLTGVYAWTVLPDGGD